MKNVLPALKNQVKKTSAFGFISSSSGSKLTFITYLSLGYATLSRGMQYVANDYSSAQKSQRENPPSVKRQNLGFLSGQGGQTALTWVWGPGRLDRPLRAVRPPWGPLAVFSCGLGRSDRPVSPQLVLSPVF